MERKELNSRVAGWALLLQEFNYILEHRPGYRMRHVDSLSRGPIVLTLENSVTMKIKHAQKDDAELRPIFKLLEGGVVPRKMQNDVIKMCHEQGHFAAKKTADLVERQFYIPQLIRKINTFLKTCVPCIMTERKMGRKEGYLHPIPKGDVPLIMYHIDHLGSLVTTKKQYRYVFCVIDGFSKFVWIYPTKTMNSKEAIQKLELQKSVFGNPKYIVADRGGAFRSVEFQDYCKQEAIELRTITTGVPTGNGQVERIFRVIIPALTKLSIECPENWYQHTDKLQRFLNNSFQRSTGVSPFQMLVGTTMRCPEMLQVKEVVEQEMAILFDEERQELRDEAKRNLALVQAENRKNFNKKRKPANVYRVGDLVLIKRTQFNTGMKLQAKYLGPYEVQTVHSNERYDVKKVSDETEGPKQTSTCAEYMKPYYCGVSDDEFSSEEDANDV